MQRRDLLAAELYSYSFANYDAHRGIGNQRFDRFMPDDAATLERAAREGWSDARLADALEVAVDAVPEWRMRFERALAIVDAVDAAAAFRNGVRFSIEDALAEGLDSAESIEQLVTQVCYRAADLAFLLDLEGNTLSEYSQALREIPLGQVEDEP